MDESYQAKSIIEDLSNQCIYRC